MKQLELEHIVELIKQITRAEILSRVVPLDINNACAYYAIKLQKEDELKEYLFGTSSLTKLGRRWGLLKRKKKKKRKR